MMLKDNTVVEVHMGLPEQAKVGSGEPKTMEATAVSKDCKPVQTAMEVGQVNVEDQSGKANAGTEWSEARTRKMEVKTA